MLPNLHSRYTVIRAIFIKGSFFIRWYTCQYNRSSPFQCLRLLIFHIVWNSLPSLFIVYPFICIQNLASDRRPVLLVKNSLLYLCPSSPIFPTRDRLRQNYFCSACPPSSKFWVGRSTRSYASEDSKRQRQRSVHLRPRVMLADRRVDDHSGIQSKSVITSWKGQNILCR